MGLWDLQILLFLFMLHSIPTFWNWSRIVFGHDPHGEASAQRSLCNMCGADMKHSSNQNLSAMKEMYTNRLHFIDYFILPRDQDDGRHDAKWAM